MVMIACGDIFEVVRRQGLPPSSAARSTISFASSSTPITPVDAGKHLFRLARQAASPAALAACQRHASPVRVAQLALPALIRIALTLAARARQILARRSAPARPAPILCEDGRGRAGVSETISARSSFLTLRMPAYVAA